MLGERLENCIRAQSHIYIFIIIFNKVKKKIVNRQ